MTHGITSQHRKFAKAVLAAMVAACLAFGGLLPAGLRCAAFADEPASGQLSAASEKEKEGKDSGKSGDSAKADKEGGKSSAGKESGASGGDAAGGGASAGKGASGAGGSGSAGQGEDDEIDPDSLYGLELYATPTNPDGNWVRPRLDDAPGAGGIHWLKEGITEKGGRLKLLARAAWGTGEAFWQYDEDWRALNLKYSSSDTSVAVVSSTGVVTAVGDGDAVFTATDQESGLAAQLGVHVIGQQGAYVTGIAVCDDSGREYGDERVTFKDTDNKLNLYVREELSDGTTVSSAPGAADYAPDALTPITWSVSDSDIGSVNADTGVFIPKALGSVKVYAGATGGDPSVKGGAVSGFVWVVIDDGEYSSSDDMPSDELTVNVVYDAYPDEVVSSQHYTIGELKSIERARSTYTLTRSEGKYVTASGEGIHLLTLIERVGVDIDQVKSFTFTALDGVNPGKMSYGFLFGERYWWPEYGYNNLSGATSVFPMLAWESNWRENDAGGEDSREDFENLSEGKRLRLLFGSATMADNMTSRSLKYISEMTVRIEGAPDITHGDGDEGAGDGSGGKVDGLPATQGGDSASEGEGDGSELDPSPASTSDPQPAPSPAGETGARQADSPEVALEPVPEPAFPEQLDSAGEPPASPTAAPTAAAGQSDGQPAAQPQPAPDQAPSAAQPAGGSQPLPQDGQPGRGDEPEPPADAAAEATGEPAPDKVGSSAPVQGSAAASGAAQQVAEGRLEVVPAQLPQPRWHVYQMLNPKDNTNFQIQSLDDNPLQPVADVLGAAALMVGAAASALAFRRQTSAPTGRTGRRALAVPARRRNGVIS